MNHRASAISTPSTRISVSSARARVAEHQRGRERPRLAAEVLTSPTRTPASSPTSRTTAASADSPGSTKPASVENHAGGQAACRPSRARPSGADHDDDHRGVGARVVLASRPGGQTRTWPPCETRVGAPHRGQRPCVPCQLASADRVDEQARRRGRRAGCRPRAVPPPRGPPRGEAAHAPPSTTTRRPRGRGRTAPPSRRPSRRRAATPAEAGRPRSPGAPASARPRPRSRGPTASPTARPGPRGWRAARPPGPPRRG